MRVDYKDVIKKRAPKCFCCREQFELHRGHNDDSILFFDNHFFHKKCFVEKNKIIRLCHECKQEIELIENSDNIVRYDGRFYHKDCFIQWCNGTKHRSQKRQFALKNIDEYVKNANSEIDILLKQKYIDSKHLDKLANRACEKIQQIFDETDLNAFLREEYGSSILGSKSTFWVNYLAPILKGTKNSQIIIPASDLLYMWKKKLDYLHKQNERLKSKHPDQIFQPIHIASYDLAILVNKYDSYLRWKEKQKILESEKEIEKSQNIVSKSIGYTNVEKCNSNNTDNISDLVDDIFG